MMEYTILLLPSAFPHENCHPDNIAGVEKHIHQMHQCSAEMGFRLPKKKQCDCKCDNNFSTTTIFIKFKSLVTV